VALAAAVLVFTYGIATLLFTYVEMPALRYLTGRRGPSGRPRPPAALRPPPNPTRQTAGPAPDARQLSVKS
jgi:peptidoglycan/LPS O-acetylase OafA/YrhL